MQEAERETSRRTEYVESGKRLLRQFDDIITSYKQQGTGYQFGITQEESLGRSYTLMNERKLVCGVFPYRPTDGAFGLLLGAGYLGVSGGLSTNFSLFGGENNIAVARWSPMRVTVSGAMIDLERWYREAGISRQTIGFLEYEFGAEPWRRDFASYFGISSADTFYDKYSRSRGMGAYNFDIVPIDIVAAFNEILLCGMRIPDRKR